ncbi:ATP-dependent DNA helicase PcrA [compost metagenome]|uniref:UvrD-helicase domain-containing protein n=1 Tax=Pseudomonas TaxID=286 RepID=UPI0008783BE1|nr:MULTISPECIES: ATP-dependent helicase [Pseudomonas]AOX07448.1 DNA helicase UvrD [Pseudomonas putida JB]MCI1022889.1 ATP-dependent helicase [Pseudomonas putida]MDN4512511.1 ATP-dependent helicase [Pseudomonas sp. 2,4-D]
MNWRPVPLDEWQPRGIPSLEPSAWTALRRMESTSVVAGPGAGKSEFLAQRAAYLLETGLCIAPQQILAISFKTDAAANLAARVRKRCPPQLAARFSSLTFDAFTKSLVDRFQAAIPEHWRPSRPYEISFPNRRLVQDELNRIQFMARPEWQARIAQLSVERFESETIGGSRLEANALQQPNTPEQLAIYQWLRQQLFGADVSRLSFVTLNRLAELIIRANPKIARALRMTYPYVFVDEFQDTSFAQYDFLLSTFGQADTVVTAVGDHKQRIMGWAGARNDAFEQFEVDFAAQRVNLLFNFRSSPELVRVQHFVAQALDPESPQIQSQTEGQLDRDVVQVWRSRSTAVEGQRLAQWIAADMAARQKKPGDYVLLVRQRPDQFEEELQPVFNEVGLSIRNESKTIGRTNVQDLMVDEAAAIALAALRLASGQRNAAAWSTFFSAVCAIRGVDEDDEVRRYRVDRDIQDFLDALGQHIRHRVPTAELASDISDRIFAFLDVGSISSTYAAYTRNDLLEIMVEAFSLHLQQAASETETWPSCIDRFIGAHDISMMTVHKSKGLEFDTVFFIGLDDQSWWSHTPRNPEGIATFFVALSRAKQRAIFLFCAGRGNRDRVSELYQLLTDAGVEEIEIR